MSSFLIDIPIRHQVDRIQEYHDEEEDDIVVFNNYIGGKATKGFIFPIPADQRTNDLLQQTIPSIHNIEGNSSKISTEWINRSVREMDFCCSKSVAYTWHWGKIINDCINLNSMPPTVYRLMYVMLRAMARSPKLPSGTKLYVLDNQFTNNVCLGFLNCYLSIEDAIIAKGSSDCKVLLYQVAQDDFIHGLWFSPENGTSTNSFPTIVIGPGMNLQFNFINRDKKSSNDPDGMITLGQEDFLQSKINYQKEGDIAYLDALTYPCICYKSSSSLGNLVPSSNFMFSGNIVPNIVPMNNQCIIAKELALSLGIHESDNIHYKNSVSVEQLAKLYVGVQSSGAIGITIDMSLAKKLTIQGEEHLVFKLVSKESDYYVYCTPLGVLYFSCIDQLLEIKMIESNIPTGTIINHSNQQLSEQIQLTIE